MTVSPLCTSSRASFLTGTYPFTHGAVANDVPMNKVAVTFAQILRSKLGYTTSYMGKVSTCSVQYCYHHRLRGVQQAKVCITTLNSA